MRLDCIDFGCLSSLPEFKDGLLLLALVLFRRTNKAEMGDLGKKRRHPDEAGGFLSSRG